MDSSAIEDMLNSAVLARLTDDSLDAFLASDRLCVLFFAGGNSAFACWFRPAWS